MIQILEATVDETSKIRLSVEDSFGAKALGGDNDSSFCLFVTKSSLKSSKLNQSFLMGKIYLPHYHWRNL